MASSTMRMIAFMFIVAMTLALSSDAQLDPNAPAVCTCNNLKHTQGTMGARNVADTLSRLQFKATVFNGELVKDKLLEPEVFGIAQCSKRLSEGDCSFCLGTLTDIIKKECADTIGAQILVKGNCRIRYEPERVKN